MHGRLGDLQVRLPDRVERFGRHRIHERHAGESARPRHRPTVRAERRPHTHKHNVPVIVVLHVLFATPDQFHRPGRHQCGNLHGLGHVVEAPGQTAAETAAGVQVVHHDSVGIEACCLGGDATGVERILSPGPHFAHAIGDPRRSGHRLEACMRQVRHGVLCRNAEGVGRGFRRGAEPIERRGMPGKNIGA